MARLWALTITPVIVMTFEFCQRGATVDTPFLTILKTWTSPLEHSVIIRACVRLEFPEVSAARLALGSLNSTFRCLVLHQTLVFFCLERQGMARWPFPHPTGCPLTSPAVYWFHRQWFLKTNGRSALYFADRHFVLASNLFSLAGVTLLHPSNLVHANCASWNAPTLLPVQEVAVLPLLPPFGQSFLRKLNPLSKLPQEAWPAVLASSRSLDYFAPISPFT